MREKPKLNKKFSDFSKKEQENIQHNRNDFDNKDILILILALYKKFLPLLLIFIGFILLGAAGFYYLY
jgi:hypothetical protein